MVRAAKLVFIVMALAYASRPALVMAQDDDTRLEAREAFQLGVDAARGGDYERATEAFATSYELVPRPAALLNLALYLGELGREVDSHAAWTELLQRFGGVISDEAQQQARAALDELEARLAIVEVRSEPSDAALSVDGREVGRTPLEGPLVLEPGEHRFEATLAGRVTATEDCNLAAGERIELDLQLAPLPEPDAPDDAAMNEALRDIESRGEAVRPSADALPSGGEADNGAVSPEQTSERRPFWRGPWPWIIGGALVLAAGATTAIVLTRPEEQDVDWEVRFR